MKKIMSVLFALMFVFTVNSSFAGLGGVPDDNSESISSELEGIWTITTTQGVSFFVPGVVFVIDEVGDKYVLIVLNTVNKKWTYGIGEYSEQGVGLVFNMLDGVTEFSSDFQVTSRNNATFVIHTCVVYEDESCATPDTTITLERVSDN